MKNNFLICIKGINCLCLWGSNFMFRDWAGYSPLASPNHAPPLSVLHYVLHGLDPRAPLLSSFQLGLANEGTERRRESRRREIGDIYFLPPVPSLLPWFYEWLCSVKPVVFSILESSGCFVSDSVGCGRAWEFVFLIGSQVLLMLLMVEGPPFEKNSCKATVPWEAALTVHLRLFSATLYPHPTSPSPSGLGVIRACLPVPESFIIPCWFP